MAKIKDKQTGHTQPGKSGEHYATANEFEVHKVPAKKREVVQVAITPPNLAQLPFIIEGISPYVQNKFSTRGPGFIAMKAKQQAGSTAKKGEKREAKDFNALYEFAQHRFEDGSNGLPAAAFRNAMISACRLCGFKMTIGKLSVEVVAEGYDPTDGEPLVRFIKGKPRLHEGVVRNETGVCDIRVRPMWEPGWQAKVTVQFDADQFTPVDVGNLLNRAGRQVGIGEGRPDSKKSCGRGWGLFKIVGGYE